MKLWHEIGIIEFPIMLCTGLNHVSSAEGKCARFLIVNSGEGEMRKGFKLLGLGVCILILNLSGFAQTGDLPYRLSDHEIRQLLHTMDAQADRFRRSLGHNLDKSRLNGTRREDDINAFVKAFDRETERLKDRFDHHKSVAADVQSILDRADSIDRFLAEHSADRRTEADWSSLRGSLDQLAQAYNVSWTWKGYSANPEATGMPYRLNDKEVARILETLKVHADRFRSAVDSSLDRSSLNGTAREDDINSFMKEFDKQTKRLRDQFDHHKSVAADVQAVLDSAEGIERFSRRFPLSTRAQNEWITLKADLDELAQAYNVSWRWDT